MVFKFQLLKKSDHSVPGYSMDTFNSWDVYSNLSLGFGFVFVFSKFKHMRHVFSFFTA